MVWEGVCSCQGGKMKYRSITACKIERRSPHEITFKLMSMVQDNRMQSQFESTNL
jgi:hypothetical protein